MKLFIASDHAGFKLKAEIAKKKGIEWIDLGTTSAESVDYPVYADKLCQAILAERTPEELLYPCGVLICGSGIGMSMAANRFPKIRAVLALREDVAVLSRQHNASNVLCLGERLLKPEEALRILDAWLSASFQEGRHGRRISQMEDIGGAS